MALARGTKVGPYEIQLPSGAGGMVAMYRAPDKKLGRDVARLARITVSTNPRVPLLQ
jgi:hypothetical protein